VVIDTQRLYHSVWHPGPEPRYCLITSYESGPELDAYITAKHGVSRVSSAPVDAAVLAEGEALAYAGGEAPAEAVSQIQARAADGAEAAAAVR